MPASWWMPTISSTPGATIGCTTTPVIDTRPMPTSALVRDVNRVFVIESEQHATDVALVHEVGCHRLEGHGEPDRPGGAACLCRSVGGLAAHRRRDAEVAEQVQRSRWARATRRPAGRGEVFLPRRGVGVDGELGHPTLWSPRRSQSHAAWASACAADSG